MHLYVGTSGYSYPAWRGKFYPKKFPQAQMLRFYSEHFSAVELNDSYYQLPTAAALKARAAEVPKTFRFAIKSPRAITHFKRLKGAKAQLNAFVRAAAGLGGNLGPLFFQLPPNFKKDLPRLKAFLKLLPANARTTFEFRHASWFEEDVYECLREQNVALCAADTEDMPCKNVVATANWGYARLRRERYSKKALAQWLEKFRSQKWDQAFVFFMHEDTGTGPNLASQLLELAEPL